MLLEPSAASEASATTYGRMSWGGRHLRIRVPVTRYPVTPSAPALRWSHPAVGLPARCHPRRRCRERHHAAAPRGGEQPADPAATRHRSDRACQLEAQDRRLRTHQGSPRGHHPRIRRGGNAIASRIRPCGRPPLTRRRRERGVACDPFPLVYPISGSGRDTVPARRTRHPRTRAGPSRRWPGSGPRSALRSSRTLAWCRSLSRRSRQDRPRIAAME